MREGTQGRETGWAGVECGGHGHGRPGANAQVASSALPPPLPELCVHGFSQWFSFFWLQSEGGVVTFGFEGTILAC